MKKRDTTHRLQTELRHSKDPFKDLRGCNCHVYPCYSLFLPALLSEVHWYIVSIHIPHSLNTHRSVSFNKCEHYLTFNKRYTAFLLPIKISRCFFSVNLSIHLQLLDSTDLIAVLKMWLPRGPGNNTQDVILFSDSCLHGEFYFCFQRWSWYVAVFLMLFVHACFSLTVLLFILCVFYITCLNLIHFSFLHIQPSALATPPK